MPLGKKNSRRCIFLAASLILPCAIAAAQTASVSADQIVAPVTVRASSSAAQTGTAQFLATFISTAARLEGPKFISCLTAAVKLRPDLAGKLVICALNIARLNAHTLTGRLSPGTIDQIIKAAVAAAPEASPDIVKAAIQSEPYARDSIIAAAVTAAPDQASDIRVAVANTTSMSILPLATTFNPAQDGPSPVNSPEQPPSGL